MTQLRVIVGPWYDEEAPAEDGAMPQADGHADEPYLTGANANLARELADRMEDAWEMERVRGHAHVHPDTSARIIRDAMNRFRSIHARDPVVVFLDWSDLTIRFKRP